MAWNFKKSGLCILFSAVLSLCGMAEGGLSQTAVLLPVSKGVLTPGEWNSNFRGALAVADAYRIPLLVFFGGLSCGKCEDLQRACLTDEFLAWQNSHKMLMVFTTHNGNGDAFRWRFDRLGNTMYFLMINEECGLALYETEDSRAVLMPVDDGNINMYMRLQ